MVKYILAKLFKTRDSYIEDYLATSKSLAELEHKQKELCRKGILV